jgi:hypothetical protein
MRWLAAVGLTVDALGVNLQQDGDLVTGEGGLGGGPGVESQ